MGRRARLAGGGDRRSSLAHAKKLLLSLVVVGLLGSVTYKRVDATLSGSTQNATSSVATGTLVVGDTVYTHSGGYTPGTQCASWTAATKNNTNANCDDLALDPATGLRFPGQVVQAYVAIQNAGSLPAKQLQLSMPTCLTVDTTGTPPYVDASTGGTGEYCATNGGGGLEMYVQEVDSTFALAANLNCVFPEDYYGTPAHDCSTNWQQDSGSGLPTISCWDLGPEAANTTRYFVVAFQIDPVAANTLQGKTVRFTLGWHLDGGAQIYDVSGHPTGSSCANAPTGIGQ